MKELVKKIKSSYNVSNVEVKYGNHLHVYADKSDVRSLIQGLQRDSFVHLNAITARDLIDENKMQVIYLLWSYELKVQLTVKINIDRDIPVILSIKDLWGQAEVYEREVHEFFGIVFEGNDNLKPLFLHNWIDIPPLRKDFITDDFSSEVFLDDFEKVEDKK